MTKYLKLFETDPERVEYEGGGSISSLTYHMYWFIQLDKG